MNNQLRFCAALVLASSIGFSAPDTNAGLDGNAFVNIHDISILARCYDQDPVNVCIRADADEDGDIDREDFFFVSERIGQAYPSILYSFPSSSNTDESCHQSTLADVNGDDSFQTPEYFLGSM